MRLQQAKYFVYIGSFLLIAYILLILLASSVPASTIAVSRIQQMQLNRLAPEGWAFFTKDPKGAELVLYEVTADKQIRRFTRRPSTAGLLFGLNRRMRIVSQEFSRLQEYFSDSLWRNIEGPVEQYAYLLDSLPAIKMPNTAQYPQLHGTYIVQSVEPVPWAWSGAKNIMAYAKSKICKIHVVRSKELGK